MIQTVFDLALPILTLGKFDQTSTSGTSYVGHVSEPPFGVNHAQLVVGIFRTTSSIDWSLRQSSVSFESCYSTIQQATTAPA